MEHPIDKAVGRPLSQAMREQIEAAQAYVRINPPTAWELFRLKMRIRFYYPARICLLRVRLIFYKVRRWCLSRGLL